MKQTAVEWLLENLISEPYSEEDFKHNAKCWDKAKQMEKEQMCKFAFDFYYDFSNQLGVPFNLISENRTNAEQYYNETFKSE